MKSPGGSGRGNKAVQVIDDPTRPDCGRCGGWMKSNGRKDWRCTECGHTRRQHLSWDWDRVPGFNIESAKRHAASCLKHKRLIVTSAQNNTAAHDGFMRSLHRAAKHYRCEIAIIPSHYKNVTLYQKGEKKLWAPDLMPYLVSGDMRFGNVLIRADVKINATTLWPLAGKQAHGGPHSWVVFGHPQIACEPVASPGNMMPKKLFTTASCTVPNYSISDAGCKAEFHHCIGALIIEKCGKHCFVRQINADEDGSFYDLDMLFTPSGTKKRQTIAAIVPGDEHVKFNSSKLATYTGKHSIVNTLKPEYIVRHDVLDGYAGSHHHDKDPIKQFQKHHHGDSDYRAELDQCIDFINETTPSYATSLIVPSNHHDHLSRWLSKVDINTDHTNALLIAELQLLMRAAALRKRDYDPFKLYAENRLTCRHEFLDRNTPFLIGDVDQSQHGDVGINGSKGSAKTMARTAYKMNLGHSHGARIVQGVYQAGTSTGRLDYERGLSDHSITHIIQYHNGKRTLIDIIDGRWHA